jgi:hypothetical protein
MYLPNADESEQLIHLIKCFYQCGGMFHERVERDGKQLLRIAFYLEGREKQLREDFDGWYWNWRVAQLDAANTAAPKRDFFTGLKAILREPPEPPPAPQPTEREPDPVLAEFRVYEVQVEGCRSVYTTVLIAARSEAEAEKAAFELERRNELDWSSPCGSIQVTGAEDQGDYYDAESEWEVVDGELRRTEY